MEIRLVCFEDLHFLQNDKISFNKNTLQNTAPTGSPRLNITVTAESVLLIPLKNKAKATPARKYNRALKPQQHPWVEQPNRLVQKIRLVLPLRQSNP